MDFGDLIILLIFLAPFLSRLFGKKRPQPGPAPELQGEREIDDPLADALRQIREALGDEVEPAEREQARPQPFEESFEREAAKSALSVPPRVSAFGETDSEFHALGEFEHEAHGFGRQNPLSEEVFEQRPAFATRGSTEPIRTAPPKQVDLTTPLEVSTSLSSRGPTLASILRDPQRAREAFILHEVFDGPRGRGPRVHRHRRQG